MYEISSCDSGYKSGLSFLFFFKTICFQWILYKWIPVVMIFFQVILFQLSHALLQIHVIFVSFLTSFSNKNIFLSMIKSACYNQCIRVNSIALFWNFGNLWSIVYLQNVIYLCRSKHENKMLWNHHR